MAYIKVRVPRTSQPQELVGIDRSNPLTKELVVAANMATRHDAVTGKPLVPFGTVFPAVTTKGWASFVATGSGDNGFRTIDNIPAWSGDKTVAVLIQDFEYLNSTVYRYACGTYDGTNGFGIASQHSSSNFWACFAGGLVFSGEVLPTSSSQFVIAVHRGGTVYLYRNGVYIGSGAAAAASSGDAPFCIGTLATTGSFSTPAKTLVAARFNRALSDVEVKALSDDPWQIFEPEERLIWIPDAVSVTLPTIGRPLSTITSGAWTATGGTGGLPGAINETTHSATEYISVASASMCELVLDTTAYPGGATQVLSYWASSTAGSTLTVRLRQNGVTVASWTHPLTTTDTLYQQPLTAPQIAALTSGAVSVQLEAS